jgi:uncharacterized protein YkwD
MLLHWWIPLFLSLFATPLFARSSKKPSIRKTLSYNVQFKDLLESKVSVPSLNHVIEYPSSPKLYAIVIKSTAQNFANFAKSVVMATLFESMAEEVQFEKYQEKQEKRKWYQKWFERKTLPPPKPVFSHAKWSGQQTLMEETLNSHNYHRKVAGSAPLKWDNELFAHAQKWADHLAAKGYIYHDVYTRPDNEGENIGINWGTTTTPLSVVIDRWVDEREIYYSRQGKQRILGYHNYSKVGHWVQVIWKSTTRVGCAYQISHVHQCIVWVCRKLFFRFIP